MNYMFQSHVENLEEQVKEQEAYHKELQEIERWLLQMSSRMVTPDPTVCGSLDSATQQLASHKVKNNYEPQQQVSPHSSELHVIMKLLTNMKYFC